MPSLLIVMLKITFQPFIKIGARLISIQVNILILQASPQAFNEYIICSPAPTIHADGDVFTCEKSGIQITGKLAALIGVHHFRFAVPVNGFFYRLYNPLV